MPDRSASTARHAAEADRDPDSLFGDAHFSAHADRVSVLLPLPLGTAYDYAIPDGMMLQPGDIVRVPLGNRDVNGVVWDPDPEAESVATARLKPVQARHDVPPLPDQQRRFIEWVAHYTMTPPGAVLRMAMSAPQAFEPPRPVTAFRLASDGAADGESDASGTKLRMTPARRRVIQSLSDGPARPLGELARAAGVSTSVIKGLCEAGVLERVLLPLPPPFPVPDWQAGGPRLSDDQSAAAAALCAKVEAAQTDDDGFSVTLLDGVTGSGKTEVYFEAVAAALRDGHQVLVLLPEIALSAQWLARFEARFGTPPAQWHSDLTSRQRRTTWRAVAFGEARVVVGARSALFLPYPALGLIVVDEEHEAAFKQEDGVIYHARDMAVVRARESGIPIVLASATPSLETVVNAEAGRYGHVSLPDRHGGADLPAVQLVDLREDKPPGIEGLGQSWLSPTLRQAVSETLAAGEQALLFLNRRGYAPLTLCRACGHRLACPNCTAWLVEHRLTRRLQCHHCGYAAARPEACPDCGALDALAACGPGVERLEEEIAALFPEARLAVMSSDTVTGPTSAERFVKAVQDHEVDLLIGTQIVAKGHHFPLLTCVGVIDADLGLTGGDLRAAERTYQMLGQVAGRAGRAERPGRVLIQTFEPGHPVMQALESGDRARFLASETEDRKRAGMPPFARLAALILSAPDPAQVEDIARWLARRAPHRDGVDILGPAPAPLAILRGRHRRRFLIRTRRDIAPQPLLRTWLAGLKLPGPARLQIDIDPYSFL